eukprot:g13184.t1
MAFLQLRACQDLGGGSRAALVTVRRAKERDFQGVAGIREVIIPVGMSGATGFMGSKVVIDSPVEAEKRLLMAKPDGLRERAARTTKTTQVFLKNLFVLPERRRRGVARELVKGAEAFAREEKAAAICLDVERKNAAARGENTKIVLVN